MSCPRHGNTSTRMIAPGQVRCTADEYEWGLDGDGRPAAYRVTCNHVSGTAAPTAGSPICADCTTYAVRFCADCASPMCDDHSVGDPRRWYCHACRRTDEEAAEAARLVRRAEDAAEQRAREAEYRSLPAVDRATMSSYLRGGTDIIDAQSHQVWDWTYRDIATVVTEDLGLSMPLSLAGATSLHADGTVTALGAYIEGRDEYHGGHSTTRVVHEPGDRIGTVPAGSRLRTIRAAARQGLTAQWQARQDSFNRSVRRTITWTIIIIFVSAVVASIIVGIAGS